MAGLTFGNRIGLLSILFALGLCRGDPAHASEARTFFIAAANGYGVEDCLGEAGECGEVVANAWCETLGRGRALTFGKSDESSDVDSGALISGKERYFVTCGD
jgi:hypothetical protein